MVLYLRIFLDKKEDAEHVLPVIAKKIAEGHDTLGTNLDIFLDKKEDAERVLPMIGKKIAEGYEKGFTLGTILTWELFEYRREEIEYEGCDYQLEEAKIGVEHYLKTGKECDWKGMTDAEYNRLIKKARIEIGQYLKRCCPTSENIS